MSTEDSLENRRACSGVSARWCDVHGQCTCPDEPIVVDRPKSIWITDDGRVAVDHGASHWEPSPDCPLHVMESDHPSYWPIEDQVLTAAAEVWKPEGVGIWYDAPNPSLHNATPRQYVEAGDGGKVLALLNRLIGGAFA